jgi:hypothetical protein
VAARRQAFGHSRGAFAALMRMFRPVRSDP